MKWPAPGAFCAKGVFQEVPISGINFSNNILVPHKANMTTATTTTTTTTTTTKEIYSVINTCKVWR